MWKPSRAVAVLSVLAACSAAPGEPSSAPIAETTNPTTTIPTTTTTSTAPAPIGAPGIGDRLYPALGNGGYDVLHYTIDLGVDPEAGSVDGATTITAVALQDLGGLHLDLAGLEVGSVALGTAGEDPVPARHERRGRELVIVPGAPIVAGVEFQVVVEYAGVPEPVPAGAVPFAPGWRRAKDSFYVFSQPDGAQSWFPTNDHPADKATVELVVRLPEGWQAVSGGRADHPSPGVFRWRYEQPVAPYLVGLAIGTFVERTEEVGGMTFTTWFDPAVEGGLLDAFGLQPEIIEFFEERFGPYPFDAVGAVVVNDDLAAALETQMVPTYTVASMAWGDVVIAHELAHQWFGNSVSVAQWDDIWLNEGLATFAHWLWIEHRHGTSVYDGQVEAAHRRFSGAELADQGVPAAEARRRAAEAYPPPDFPRPDDLFTVSVYERGALALVALRDLTGDEVTFQVLRTWTARFAYGNATTEDFLGLVAEVAGPEVAAVVEAWIRDAEVPSMPGRNLEPPG
ncbi:MAG: M1 family metallopeptidase [Acidimicrobiia bacterium]|jgi:aminopeptidase N